MTLTTEILKRATAGVLGDSLGTCLHRAIAATIIDPSLDFYIGQLRIGDLALGVLPLTAQAVNAGDFHAWNIDARGHAVDYSADLYPSYAALAGVHYAADAPVILTADGAATAVMRRVIRNTGLYRIAEQIARRAS